MATMENSKIKTSVWWDIENCEVPKGWDAHAIARNVGSALLNMNYSGPVSILAYGDTNLIPHHVQQALSSTGVGLNHVPAGVKDASDKKILVDMLLWAVDNPAPANIMLISGDRDFSNALHQLSMRRYTILLAHPPHASAPLVAAAKNVWLWTSLASGGPPLTSGVSSQLVNNGRCNVSNPVSEPAQSSKPTGSTCVAGDTKDHKTRDNHVPRGATGESVTSSDSFRAHLPDKSHTPQAAFIASPKAYATVSAKPIQVADVVEPVLCVVCQISCISKDAYARHTYGKRHRNNLDLQSGKIENVSLEPASFPKEVLTRQSRRIRRKQRKALIGSKKLEDKSVGQKSQPREESIAEPQLQSQNTQGKTKCLEKQSEELREILLGTSESCVKERLPTKDPAETVNKQLPNGETIECSDGFVNPKEVLARQNRRIRIRPRKALIGSKKLQEKIVGEKSQPREETTMAEPQLQSQNTQEKHVAMVNEAPPVETISEPQLQSPKTHENTKFLEKQSEELRKILLGTSESSVKEKLPRTKDQAQTVNKQLPNEEARESIDGIVKPVNQFEGATYHSGEVKQRRAIRAGSKSCKNCVVICDSQGFSTLVCDNIFHWTNHPLADFLASDDAGWCQVCQISCNSKAAYENHTNGEKHRQKLELQSVKNENESKGQAKLSEENAERMKKVLCKDQTAFDSQNHDVVVRDQTEAFDKEKLREAMEQAQEESDQGAQEDKEEVKEINAISENLVHVFNAMNRESRIPKESRGCLDVIPERTLVSPDVNVTGKFEDESKHKQEREKECAGGGKERLGEAAKREESKKVQVDNLWTRLWWGKS